MLKRLASFLRLERRSLAFPSPELLALFGVNPTAAGALVNPTTALQSTTALACMRLIAEAVGGLPIHLFRRLPDGGRTRETEHPVAQLLAGDWVPWAGGVETRTAMQFDLLLHGLAVAQVIRARGEPREAHRLPAACVTEELTPAGEPQYRYRDAQGVEHVLGWRDCIVIRTPGAACDRPLCLLSGAREAIGLDLEMAAHQGRLFRRGARPGGVFKYAKMLSAEAAKRLKESLAAHSGEGAGANLVLEDGMSFEPLQFSSVDSQFLELRRFIVEEIARAFKIAPTMIGSLERATWRNSEEMARQFIQYTLLPWLEVWQAALTRALLKPEERGELFLELIVDDLLRGDLQARFAAFRNAVGGAWMTPNEARRLDNLAPVEGGDALIRQAGQGDASAPAGVTPAPATRLRDAA